MTQQVIHPEADQQVTPQQRPTTNQPRGPQERGVRSTLAQLAWLVALGLVVAMVTIGYLASRGDEQVRQTTVAGDDAQIQREKEIMRERASSPRQAPSSTRDLSPRPGGRLEGTE